MSVELDPPLVEIVKRKKGERFASVRRGYDSAQVDALLSAIVSRIEALEMELQQSRVTADVPRMGEDPARVSPPSSSSGAEANTEHMDRLSSVALRELQRMVADAKTEAATIVSVAAGEVDRITGDAQGAARRSVDEARAFLIEVEEDARRTLSDVAERRRQMTEGLRKMQEHLVSVAQDLDIVLDAVEPDTELPAGSARIQTSPGS